MEDSDSQSTSSNSLISKVRSVITLEPAIFMCTLGYGLQSIISQNLMIAKVCLINLNITKEICDNLTHNKDEEKEVQVITAELNMYLQILTAIPAIIVSLFLGPWSDQNGRKPLMICAMLGTIINQVIYIFNTYLTFLPGEYILLTGIGSVFGGFTSFLVGMYGYISDVTGFPVGTIISGPIFAYGGYYAVFGLAGIFTFLGMIYIIFLIKDTRGPFSNNSETQTMNYLSVFSIFNVLEVFKTCFKRRYGYTRAIILLLILTMLFNLAGFEAGSLVYLFARLKLDWTEQDYTKWSAAGLVLCSISTVGVMALLSFKWKIHDALIGIFGGISGALGRIVIAFATKSWMMYLGTVVGMISSMPAMTIRSYLSKVTPKENLGSIFSLLASLEAAIPIVISPLMTYVYKHTINVFPGAIMIVQAGIYILSISTLSIVYILSKKTFDIEETTLVDNEETVDLSEESISE